MNLDDLANEYVSKAAVLAQKGDCYDAEGHLLYAVGTGNIMRLPAADVKPVPDGGIGEMSDGYHTFNGLYYQRMILFAALVNAHRDRAWKSWKHEDGKPCFDGGWFIVGIDAPQGSYTYHYEDKYWNWFECEELPTAKHWDGHTEEDVTRLLSLPDVKPAVLSKWEWNPDGMDWGIGAWVCGKCGSRPETWWNTIKECHPLRCSGSRYCGNCGADMREQEAKQCPTPDPKSTFYDLLYEEGGANTT